MSPDVPEHGAVDLAELVFFARCRQAFHRVYNEI
jgi:hypothetical protein